MAGLPTSVPVGVVGAGTMGAGIAQVAAAAGHPVLLCDAQPGAVEAARAGIAERLERMVDKGRLSADQCAAILARLHGRHGLDALTPAGLVIEAITEDQHAKRELFESLQIFLRPDAILATNTSSFSITALAAKLQDPGRLVGLHFFNPAPIMPLVEVIRGLATRPDVLATALETVRAWGKTPVEATSTPGFIVNRIARPFYGEALRALSEGAADVATVDAVMREGGGFRMGPFELMDLIGLDVNLAVSRSVHAACHFDPRYAPSLIQEEMVEAGRLGRKTGRGFYPYGLEEARPEPHTMPPGPAPEGVVIEGDLGLAEPLAARLAEAGVAIERKTGEGLIRLGTLRLALTDGRSATERSTAAAAPVVLFDLAHDYARCARLAIAPADQASGADRAAAAGLFQAAGIQVSLIDDWPGMIVMRTVCMLGNEAADAVHHGVAAAEAVDTAMRLGVNYPRGPLEWVDVIGPAHVLAVLDHLFHAYGEDRYRAAWLLRRRALAGGRLRA